ncbi:hypothetical protein [Enterobacter ludwigii]|uniref:hypothetical protein n=1 Tax=Enterobacter ludwigii TaxID=299767 RepID=UPI000839CCF7|nr:hypothetical protein [Enterobacter ludwigii]
MNKCFSKKITLLAGVLSLATFNASAAWTVNGTFCQTYSDDGRVIVRVKPSTVGLIEMKPQCNGRGASELIGSNFGVNGTGYPSSVMCNAQTQYYAVQTTMATKDIRAIINTFSKSDSVSIDTFGSVFSVNTADFASACASIINQKVADIDPQATMKNDMEKMGYKQDANGQWQKQSKTATPITPESEAEIKAAQKRDREYWSRQH